MVDDNRMDTHPKPNLVVLVTGAALVYVGIVGATFFGSFWMAGGGGALAILLYAPLPLCGAASIALVGAFYAACRRRGLGLARIAWLWVHGSLAGFVAWWFLFNGWTSTHLEVSEDVVTGVMFAILLFGALLMFVAMPSRDRGH